MTDGLGLFQSARRAPGVIRPAPGMKTLDPIRAQLAHLLAAWLVGEVRKDAESRAVAAPTVVSPSGHDRSGLGPVSPARRGRRPAGAEAIPEGR
jgi:hypothetical protein